MIGRVNVGGNILPISIEDIVTTDNLPLQNWMTGHNHDTLYSKLSHTHSYAGSQSVGGPADTAIKLNTIRKIGNANFDGSANITLAQIGAAATSHTHTKSQITDFPISLKNPYGFGLSLNGVAQTKYDGSALVEINITPTSIGASPSAHTHSYAGSGSVGGPANSAVKLNTARKIGNATFDGTKDITIEDIGVTGTSHTHTKSQITDFPSSLKNPSAFTLQLNGTSQGAYDGSAAKIVNITPAAIGAAPAAGSTSLGKLASTITLGDGANACILQNAATYQQKINIVDNATSGDSVFEFQQSTDSGISFKNLMIIRDDGNIVATKFTGALAGNSDTTTKFKTARKIGNASFDGTADISLTSIGAAATSHTHTKSQITDFPSSLKNPTALTISLNGTSQGAYDGSTAKSFNITADSVGAATATHTHTKSQITDFPATLKNPNALTLQLNGTSQGAYDGSTAKTVNITSSSIGAAAASHTHTYLPLAGGTVTGELYLKKGYYVHSAGGTGGETGYVLIAQIKITSTYVNSPIILELVNRGEIKTSTRLSITFTNANSADPTLSTFTYYGHNIGAYLYKSAASTWDLYIKKSESYDSIGVTQLLLNPYVATKLTVNWKNTQAAALPTGYVTAGLWLEASSSLTASKLATARKIGNASFDGSADITLAQIGAATSSHTHTKSQITDFPAIPTSLKNPYAITISLNGTSQGAYDGSAAKSFNITAAAIGAAASSHTHTKSQITDFPTIPTALKNPNALTISLNGTSQGAYDGSTTKAINITAAGIGAALTSHSHNYAASTSAGGPATTATKLATARKIGNATFDGTSDISLAQIGIGGTVSLGGLNRTVDDSKIPKT